MYKRGYPIQHPFIELEMGDVVEITLENGAIVRAETFDPDTNYSFQLYTPIMQWDTRLDDVQDRTGKHAMSLYDASGKMGFLAHFSTAEEYRFSDWDSSIRTIKVQDCRYGYSGPKCVSMVKVGYKKLDDLKYKKKRVRLSMRDKVSLKEVEDIVHDVYVVARGFFLTNYEACLAAVDRLAWYPPRCTRDEMVMAFRIRRRLVFAVQHGQLDEFVSRMIEAYLAELKGLGIKVVHQSEPVGKDEIIDAVEEPAQSWKEFLLSTVGCLFGCCIAESDSVTAYDVLQQNPIVLQIHVN